jgi:transposase
MATIAQSGVERSVLGGVDTHKDVHVAAVIDDLGRDAEAAARAVLAGEATVTPKTGTGPVEALRQLRVARTGAMKARTAAANQLHSLIDTAPDRVRAQLRDLTFKNKVAVAAAWRPAVTATPDGASRYALASVARRWQALAFEIAELDRRIKTILDDVAAPLIAVHGVGYHTAGQLLVTAGDNPDRLRHERSYAALCGSSPVQVSSGKTDRHRLNRGGDRHAVQALVANGGDLDVRAVFHTGPDGHDGIDGK